MNAEVLDHLKHVGRVLRAGDVVEVRGKRGRYTIRDLRVWPDDPDRLAEVSLVGGPRHDWHTVTIDRIGVRKALAPNPKVGATSDDRGA